jgi:ribose transport system substrate-binding protein
MTRTSDIKKLLKAAIIAVVVALVCGYAMKELHQFPQEPKDITVIIKSTAQSMEFWQVLTEGVNAAAREFGVNAQVVGPPKETDIDVQIKLLQQAVKDRPDAIVMAATDYNRLATVTSDVDAAGIPLITVDSAVNSEVPRSFIATDNVEAGKKAGRKVAELTAGKGKIAIISYVKETATQIQRERGVREVLEVDDRFEIVGTYYSNGDEQIAYDTTTKLMHEHPDLKGLVGLNEPSSVGAGRAIKDLGKGGKVMLVGFDSSIDEVRLLEAGVIQATIVQRPFNMGYLGVKTAVDILSGRRVPAVIDTGSLVITKSNMYEVENQQLLFPFG